MKLIPKKNSAREANPIILIDVANLAFRSAFSFKGILIQIDNGVFVNTGVIYKIIDTIIQLYNRYNPSAIFFVFEGDKANNPRYNDPEYKSKRPTSKTIDITTELLLIREIITLFGIMVAIPKRGEADDGIAALTKLFQQDYPVIIYSNDHDMQVLLRNNVRILKPKFEFRTKQSFINEYNFPPKYLSLMLAVAGDASDNLAGVYGIGEKKAAPILAELLQNGTKPTVKSIAKALFNKYKSLQKKHTINDLIKVISRYYTLTKLHPEWGIDIRTKEPDDKLLRSMLHSLKMKQFLHNFDRLNIMLSQLFKNQSNIIAYLKRKQQQ